MAETEWVLVPREPTPDMIHAGVQAWYAAPGEDPAEAVATWKAMLSTAPAPPVAGEVEWIEDVAQLIYELEPYFEPGESVDGFMVSAGGDLSWRQAKARDAEFAGDKIFLPITKFLYDAARVAHKAMIASSLTPPRLAREGMGSRALDQIWHTVECEFGQAYAAKTAFDHGYFMGRARIAFDSFKQAIAITPTFSQGFAAGVEAAGKIVDAECDRVLGKQTGEDRPGSTQDEINKNLRMIAVLLPDIAESIRALTPPPTETPHTQNEASA